MDIPKINNTYKAADNLVPEISGSENRNGQGHRFPHSEEETSTEQKEEDRNVFLNSYLKNSETFLVSTNEWLGTWRPLI